MSLTAARDQKTRKINNWDAPTHTKVQRLPTRKQWYSLLPCDLAPGSAQHVQCSPMSMPRAKQLWGPAAVGLLWVWVWVSCGAKQLWGLTHSKGTYHPHVLHHLGYHMLNTSRLFHSLLSVPRSSCKLEAMSKHDSSVMSLIDAQGILPKGGLFARSMPLPLEVADDGCLVPVDMSDSQSSDICCVQISGWLSNMAWMSLTSSRVQASSAAKQSVAAASTIFPRLAARPALDPGPAPRFDLDALLFLDGAQDSGEGWLSGMPGLLQPSMDSAPAVAGRGHAPHPVGKKLVKTSCMRPATWACCCWGVSVPHT
mmetsp:Transcript_42163/g.126260  ORF Transcript_42163/g.126260 Transcript_42163/m.126260 type:complete len:312 (+) Transcript_42163:1024-1959(+)